MASYKRRQCSDNNQSIQETENIPETHAYQEKHFQPTLNTPVSEGHAETEYGSTVTPDKIVNRNEKSARSTYTESSDQPGENDLSDQAMRQELQGNSDSGTQYSTPDVSSGVSSGPGGFTGIETGTVAASASSTVAASTVAVSSTAATISSMAVATAGAVIIAATVILPLVIGVPSAIIFEDISVTDTTVYYTIYFEDYEEDMDLTVSLHNIFTDRSHKVESHSISIMEKDLKPGTEYTITVYGSMMTVLEEKVVRTEDKPSYPTSVTFGTVSATDKAVSYSVSFEGYSSDMDLTVSLHNSTTVRSHTVDAATVSFTDNDLDYGTEYFITVYGKGDVVLGETRITTGYPDSEFTVSAAEFSMTDGLIHLSAEVSDPAGSWGDFRAVFYDETDGKHIEVRSVPITSFDSEITLDAELASDTYIDGSFTVECTEGGANKVLFSKDLRAYGTPYFAWAAEPTISEGSMAINCIIIDPESVRTDYHVMFYIQDETDYSAYYDDDGALVDGSYTVTGIPSYTYYSYFVKLTWEEGGVTKGKIIEEKNFETPVVTIDTSGIELAESGGEYVLNVPVTVTDPLGGWGELTMILGDSTRSSSVSGIASVVTFTGDGTVVVPVTEYDLYGLSLPITVKKVGGAELARMSAKVIGPTMTVGQASMTHVSESISGTTYETKFEVVLNDFVDDLHYLTDESGGWKTIMPILTATRIPEDMTALRVTQNGEGSYIASFYAENWNEARMYRDLDTFTFMGRSEFTKDFSMVYIDEDSYQIYTQRDSSGNITAGFTVRSTETITNAVAIDGSTEIAGTVTNPYTDCYTMVFDLTTADPYAAYVIQLYNGTTPLDYYVNETFPYPRLVSATYNESTTTATVVFNFSQGPIYMPEVPSATITQEGGVLTLVFALESSKLNEPVHFAVADKTPNYYWPVTYEIIT